MKGIKVSEEVHDELAARKYKGESFDKVLKRELGLVPQTVEELTAMLPKQLSTAVTTTVNEFIDIESRYKRIGHRAEDELVLKYVSRDSNKVIYEISVYLPTGSERVNNRVNIRYRTPQNDLQRIVEMRDIEDVAIEINGYVEFDTREVKETTRQGEDAGRTVAEDLIGPEVEQFVEQAYDVWG